MGQQVKNLLRAQSKYVSNGSSTKTGKKIFFYGSQEQFLGGLSLHLNHLIGSRMTNYDWPFWTLPFGLFWSNLGHKGP